MGAPRHPLGRGSAALPGPGNPALTLQERLTRTLGASLQPLALQIPLEDPDRLPARWNKLSPILREAGLPVPDWKIPRSRASPRAGIGNLASAGAGSRRQGRPGSRRSGGPPDGPGVGFRESRPACAAPCRRCCRGSLSRKTATRGVSGTGSTGAGNPAPGPALTVPLRLDEAALLRLTPIVEAAGGRFVGTQPLFRVVKGIAKEAVLEAVLLALAGIFVVIAVFGRSLRFAWYALVPLLASQAGVFGALGWGGEPLTFLSLMAIPIALGVSVDTAFNLLHRARSESRRAPARGPGERRLRGHHPGRLRRHGLQRLSRSAGPGPRLPGRRRPGPAAHPVAAARAAGEVALGEEVNPLNDILQARLAQGPVPAAEVMALGLYHPEHGYYRRPKGPGASTGKDYYTALDLGPLLGQTLALRLEAAWERLGRPARFTALEPGAGRGWLGRDVLNAVSGRLRRGPRLRPPRRQPRGQTRSRRGPGSFSIGKPRAICRRVGTTGTLHRGHLQQRTLRRPARPALALGWGTVAA